MKAHGHYFSSEIPWESSVRSHGHNTTILILNFNEKHKCYLEQEHYETPSPLWVWLAGLQCRQQQMKVFWVRSNVGNYQDKGTVILHQHSCRWSLSVSLRLSVPLSVNMSSAIGKLKHSSLTPSVFLQSMIKYRITGFYANFGGV